MKTQQEAFREWLAQDGGKPSAFDAGWEAGRAAGFEAGRANALESLEPKINELLDKMDQMITKGTV